VRGEVIGRADRRPQAVISEEAEMSSFRGFRVVVASVAFIALMLGADTVAAAPAMISARTHDWGDGNFSITISWNSGSDNGNPVVWVCQRYNGNAPLTLDMGASGSQLANFIPPGTYVFGLYADSGCSMSVDNQSVTVVHRGSANNGVDP
jgi:hypothetical protein